MFSELLQDEEYFVHSTFLTWISLTFKRKHELIIIISYTAYDLRQHHRWLDWKSPNHIAEIYRLLNVSLNQNQDKVSNQAIDFAPNMWRSLLIPTMYSRPFRRMSVQLQTDWSLIHWLTIGIHLKLHLRYLFKFWIILILFGEINMLHVEFDVENTSNCNDRTTRGWFPHIVQCWLWHCFVLFRILQFITVYYVRQSEWSNQSIWFDLLTDEMGAKSIVAMSRATTTFVKVKC